MRMRTYMCFMMWAERNRLEYCVFIRTDWIAMISVLFKLNRKSQPIAADCINRILFGFDIEIVHLEQTVRTHTSNPLFVICRGASAQIV